MNQRGLASASAPTGDVRGRENACFPGKESGREKRTGGTERNVHTSRGGSRGREATFSKLGEQGERVRERERERERVRERERERESRSPINKDNEIAVESEERWDGWSGLDRKSVV